MTAQRVRTACPYCGVGCGVLATPAPDGGVEIRGDPDHPSNGGRLCSKGAALGDTLALDDRLLHPLVNGARAGWDAALAEVAGHFARTIREHGPDAVAFYVSGQLLTEDYYVANKLMKGFIGSANIDTNSRLCMASSVAGHKRAFGSDTVPGTYEDLDLADLVVLVGSNLAWCHPVLFQRLAAARAARGTKVVVIDPRLTATSEIADLSLQLAPDSDVALFNGLLNQIIGANAVNRAYVDAATTGFAAAQRTARELSVRAISEMTGISNLELFQFYDMFVSTERVVTVYSQGVNQSVSGTDKVNAIINCHLATGRIGRPGMGPFSVTGQPNAMGGREVGGLANMLAAHMDLDNAHHREIVQAFWRSPRVADRPGLKAVDLFDAIGDGRVKAVWIMATNPVDSLPEADKVRAALKACPFVVVSDIVRHTDTTALAHVLLPSTAWGEKDGTVTNSERRISRQRAFLSAPGEARPDWWQLAEVGRRMGYADAFRFDGPAAIFAEYAAMTALANNGARDLDIGAHADIRGPEYDRLEPFQWPQPAGQGPQTTRFFADGRFFTPDRRARFVATPVKAAARPPAADAPPAFAFVLNTGRIRDQWHTMTRTGKAARLMSHIAEPFVEVHPADAARLGLSAAGLAAVRSPHGQVVVRVQISERQRRGSVFVPMHWTDQLAASGRVDAVVPAAVDPVSGQPALKHARVAVEPFAAAWFGLVIGARRPTLTGADYWAVSPVKAGWRAEVAGCNPSADVLALAQGWLGLAESDDGAHEILSYHDNATGQVRLAAFRDEALLGAVFVARDPVAVSRAWAAEQLAEPVQEMAARLRLLAGRPGAAAKERGRTVCACFEIGLNEIVDAITAGGCRTVEAVGAAIKAGTNCGSCRPEIGRLIEERCIERAV